MGKTREMGLGSFYDVKLAQALEARDAARALVRQGLDPIEQKAKDRGQAIAIRKIEAAKAITFDQCAESYIRAHEAAWRNPKHRQQWRNTIKTYASPVFGALPVSEIDTNLVLEALEPIWTSKVETAGRLRGRIESILAWAAVKNYRSAENPAR